MHSCGKGQYRQDSQTARTAMQQVICSPQSAEKCATSMMTAPKYIMRTQKPLRPCNCKHADSDLVHIKHISKVPTWLAGSTAQAAWSGHADQLYASTPVCEAVGCLIVARATPATAVPCPCAATAAAASKRVPQPVS